MKKVLFAIAALCVAFSLDAQPQNQHGRPSGKEMRDRLQSEHVAYLTSELELTPEESQAFWPVYNKAQKEQKDNFEKIAAAKKALKDALKENKSEKEVAKALKEYNKVRTSVRNVFVDYEDEFVKVLGVTKTAKLYIAEDNFRTRQIHRLGDGRGNQPIARPQSGRKQAGKSQGAKPQGFGKPQEGPAE